MTETQLLARKVMWSWNTCILNAKNDIDPGHHLSDTDKYYAQVIK